MSTSITGGLRARLVYDSLFYAIEAVLTELGWFDSNRSHDPITMVREDVSSDESVAYNTLAVVPSDMMTEHLELGSNLADNRRTYYIDFYAQNSAVGEHLTFDLRDAFEGRMRTSAPSGDVVLPLMNYSIATPDQVGLLSIESIVVDKSERWAQPWERFWYSISMTVVDTYDGEDSP